MKLGEKSQQILKWISRILAATIILFGLPFYFGYGNPLAFINSDYSMCDKTWLIVFPLMFIGLAIGWKIPIVGILYLIIGYAK